MRRLASWLTWPAMVGGGMLGVHTALARGVSPPLALGALQLAVFAIVAALERWMPEQPDWNRAHGDTVADALHTLVSGLVVSGILRLGIFALVPGLGLWPASWPLALQLPLAILLVDLGSYGTHVLCHRLSWLWPIHAVHHSARRLYWLNTSRMHPLDSAATVVVSLLPLAILGAPPPVLAMLDAVTLVHIVLQHSNVRLRLGPLGHLVAGAEFHRFHHSREPAVGEHNYATFLSFIDHVFGTYRMQERALPPDAVGLYGNAGMPDGWRAQLLYPFRAWAALARPRKVP